jgi:hypothetical protein
MPKARSRSRDSAITSSPSCAASGAAVSQARALAWDAPREHQMLNASINRVGATTAPLALRILDWGDVAHLAQARDETLS